MTVRRSDSVTFSATRDRVAAAVRDALASGRPEYKYIDIQEHADACKWTARIKPAWPLLLSTQLAVSCTLTADGSRVSVETKSQPYIFGDVMNFYRGYIRDLLDTVGRRLADGT